MWFLCVSLWKGGKLSDHKWRPCPATAPTSYSSSRSKESKGCFVTACWWLKESVLKLTKTFWLLLVPTLGTFMHLFDNRISTWGVAVNPKRYDHFLHLFFRSLFQNSPSQKNDVFNLVIQDVSGIGQILDYMYTSHLDINQENVQALLDIAQNLQVPNVQNLCNAFLKPCPPPVEMHSFTLPGMLGSEHDCLLGSSLTHDVNLHCPTEPPRPNLYSDTEHTRRMPFCLPNSSSNCDMSSSSQPAERPLHHGYKLRNFYSKQYFKLSAIQTNNAASNQVPGPLMMAEEQACQLGITPRASDTSVTSGNPLSSQPPSASAGKDVRSLMPSDNLNTPNTDLADSLSNKPVRPKKAVYLKKYNYLRSQKALEEMCNKSVNEPVISSPIEHHQGESVVQTETSEAPVEISSARREEVSESAEVQLSNLPGSQDEPNLKSLPEPPQQPGHKQYCCGVCGKIFKHPSNLELHKRSHTGITCFCWIWTPITCYYMKSLKINSQFFEI